MKKLICLIAVLAVALFALTACATTPVETEPATTPEATTEQEVAEKTNADPVDVSVVAMNGPTAMGMVHFMNAAESGEVTSNNYSFSIETAIDVVNTQVAKGEVDIAAVPANVSSVLYNNTDGKLQVLAINTLGVLYIVESGETIQSIEDLSGKTIYASGKGATPEYALTKILDANGLADQVTVEWKSEQAEVVAALAAEENAVAMLPQPFATTAQMSNDKIRVALDLTEVWNGSEIDGNLITGVVVANKEFVEQNPEAVADFMANYETSVNFINENLEQGAALVGQYEIVPEPVALSSIPYCNISFIAGDEMKDMLSGYLGVLFDQNPASIGGAMPDDTYYYAG